MIVSVILLFFIIQTSSASLNDIFNENVIYKVLVPNLGEENSLCRNHSRFYLDELEKLKLWAAEMYDASGKFPAGILYGSPYAMGQYDQCIEIKVPYQNNQDFTGKYCMTKIKITPNYKYKMKQEIDFEFDDYANFYNISAWSKMLAYSDKESKASRSEIYFSFCLPSTCTENDLQVGLNKIVENINKNYDFKLNIETNEHRCDVKTKYIFSAGDIVFITFISFSVGMVLLCSLYDMFTRSKTSKLKQMPGKLHDILISFSIPKNLKKLSSPTNNKDGLDCLCGIKVISLFLIILGHRCMFTFGAPLLNPIFVEKIYSRFEATAILNGTIIVDTFFLISGFLASYFTLNILKNSMSINHIFLIYVHRIIRLTPTYAVVLAFYCTIFDSLGSGPFWKERIGVEKDRCLQSWWTNLLYINNYVNVDKLCMFQSWYITCDMHYFLVVPFLVLLIKKNAKWGIAAIITLIIASIGIVLALVYINNQEAILLLYMKLLRDPIGNETFKTIYIPSHMRASPYFVGVMTGYLKYRMKNSTYKLPNWLYRTGWVISVPLSLITLHLGFIFYLPTFPKHSIISGLYAGFHHFTFSAANAWLIIAVSSGKGPWIEPLLSWKPFILLSRISYSAFLCHGAVQLYTAAILHEPTYATVFTNFYATFGDIVMAYSFGFLLTMVYESPIISLEKIIFGKRKSTQPTSNNNQDEEVKSNNQDEEVKSNSIKVKINNNDS